MSNVVFNVVPEKDKPVVYPYFTVHCRPAAPGRKLPTYEIVNNRSELPIGLIMWYGPWRAFCFFPSYDSVWSASCLDEINRLLITINKSHKGSS